MEKYINDYLDIIEKYGTDDLKAVKNEILFMCGRSYARISESDFMKLCTACGGNWAGMLYSGMKVLYPLVYDLIPETPVDCGTANFCLASTILRLCGVSE